MAYVPSTHEPMICKINGKTYKSATSIVNFLRTQNLTSEEYYLQYVNPVRPTCYCGALTSYDGLRKGYRTFCSDICAMKSDWHRNIVKTRFQKPGVREKYLERIAVAKDNPQIIANRHNSAVRTAAALKEKHGEYYFTEKALRQWETKDELARKAIGAKIVASCRKRGVYERHQNRYQRKLVTFNEVDYYTQGYEDAILELLNSMDVGEIKTGITVPRIVCDDNRTYYPDFYLPRHNLLIEVKSEYTYRVGYEETRKKHHASLQQGFRHLVLVVDQKQIAAHRDKTLCRSLKSGPKVNVRQLMEEYLNKAISSQASEMPEEGSTTIPQGSRGKCPEVPKHPMGV